MKVKIDQEELCLSCERDSSRCEGSGCDEAYKAYIGDHGLVELTEKSTFSDVDTDDSLYVLIGNQLLYPKVLSILKKGNMLQITFVESEAPVINVNEHMSSANLEGVAVYLDGKRATLQNSYG